MKLCTQCRFCAQYDYGYSNWTVEGSTLACIAGLNPDMEGKEEGYRPDESVQAILRKAESCQKFSEGSGPSFDCDGEVTAEDYKGDPEVYAMLTATEPLK